jgi:hypothetical protein
LDVPKDDGVAVADAVDAVMGGAATPPEADSASAKSEARMHLRAIGVLRANGRHRRGPAAHLFSQAAALR